jgi:hypothetical protein
MTILYNPVCIVKNTNYIKSSFLADFRFNLLISYKSLCDEI